MLLRSNENGQVAVIVAICILPLLFLAGFMLDFSRQQSLARDMQASLDHAAVSVAIHLQDNAGATNAELVGVAQAVFDANLQTGTDFTAGPIQVVEDGETANLMFSADMSTGLAGIMGVKSLPVNIVSTAQYAGGANLLPLDIALVVDVSSSMQGSKIDALRDAAKDLIDLALPPSAGGGATTSNVRMGIVPFNHYVNVGLGQVGRPWLTGTGTGTRSVTSCSIDQPAVAAAGCSIVQSCNLEGNCFDSVSCPAGVTEPAHICTTSTEPTEFKGCVLERPIPLDVEDSSYGSDRIVGRQLRLNDACFSENEIVPLTNDADRLRDAIEGLRPVWLTYIPSGIAWGQRVLSPGEPFTYIAQGRPRTKAMILMSDGANSRSINSNLEPNASDINEANDRFEAACEAAKDAGVQVFTIAFDVNDIQTEKLLEDCASDPDGSFDVNNGTQLSLAFSDIASTFSQITLVE